MRWWSLAFVVLFTAASLALAGPPKKRPKKKVPDAGVVTRGTGNFKFGTLEIKVKGSAHVYVDERDLGATPVAPIKLLEGSHKVRFVNEKLGLDEVQTVDIRAGQIATLEVSFET